MAADETVFKPGDTDNNLLRKILAVLIAGGGSGGGGGGGAVTIANGADVAEGSTTDGAVTNPAASATVVAALKGVLALIGTSNSELASIFSAIALNNNVGGYSTAIKDTTAVSASSAYTAGDAVGAKRTLTNALRSSGGTGILDSIILLDRANQKAAMELFIFDSDPTAATITDNAAFIFSTDDLKVLARIPIAATDYVTINSKAIVTLKGLGVVLKGNATSTLYAALVTTGTPTYSATTDVQLIYGILQD